jgi:hypothetical protein
MGTDARSGLRHPVLAGRVSRSLLAHPRTHDRWGAASWIARESVNEMYPALRHLICGAVETTLTGPSPLSTEDEPRRTL